MNGAPHVPVAFTTVIVETAAILLAVVEGHREIRSEVLDGGDVGGAHHLEPEVLLVLPVVVGDDVLGGSLPVGGIEAEPERIHAGKVVDPVGGPDAQRLPAELPRAARARTAIEHDEVVAGVEAESLKVVGDREPGLSRADHDDRSVGARGRHLTTLPAKGITREKRRGAQLPAC